MKLHIMYYKIFKMIYLSIANYNTVINHNQDHKYTNINLSMTKREYYVQCTKYQYIFKIHLGNFIIDFTYYSIHSLFQIYYHLQHTYNTVCNEKITMSLIDYSKWSLHHNSIFTILYDCIRHNGSVKTLIMWFTVGNT